MTITKAAQKALLYSLFFDVEKSQTGAVSAVPKKFSLDKIADAGSAAKKLAGTIDAKGERVKWDDSEIKLTPAESVIIKVLFDEAGRVGFAFGDFETVAELQQIFNGK